MFSGTVFTKGANGFGVQQVPWDCEAPYELPVAVWQQMIESYYPNTGWIRLDHDVLTPWPTTGPGTALTTWEETVQTLLAGATGHSS